MGRLFNGTSDVITATGINPNGFSALTISAWFKATSTGGGYAAVAGFGTNYAIYQIGTQVAGLTQHGGTGNQVGAAGSVAAGSWYNLVLTDDRSLMTLYLNGTSVATHTITGGPVGFDSIATWFIGTDPANEWFGGSIADVAYWNAALSSSDIAKLAAGTRPTNVNLANLKGWWPLDGYQSPEPDLSGNANNGTLTGTARILGRPQLWRLG